MKYGNIPYWQSDPDYYSKKDERREAHRDRIKENNRVDNLVEAASSDGSYSIFFKKPK